MVYSKTGNGGSAAASRCSLNFTDTFVILKPRGEWLCNPNFPQQELVARLDAARKRAGDNQLHATDSDAVQRRCSAAFGATWL